MTIASDLEGLAEAMSLQIQQQAKFFGVDLDKLTNEERIQFFNTNILAATDELHEMLGEAPWKPWSKNYGNPEHYNDQAMAGEGADVLCFFFNALWASGVTPQQLVAAYVKKLEINAARQLAGYDVSAEGAKCPVCKRALDDPSTECKPGFCAGV